MPERDDGRDPAGEIGRDETGKKNGGALLKHGHNLTGKYRKGSFVPRTAQTAKIVAM
jgi:hypothetical protein